MAILGYPTTTTSAAPARHLQHTTPNQDKTRKKNNNNKKNTIVLPLLQNLTNNRNRPMLFEIVDQYTESGAHY